MYVHAHGSYPNDMDVNTRGASTKSSNRLLDKTVVNAVCFCTVPWWYTECSSAFTGVRIPNTTVREITNSMMYYIGPLANP